VPRAADPTRFALSRRFSPASPTSPSRPASPHRPVLSLSLWLPGLLVSSACVVVVDDGTGALVAVCVGDAHTAKHQGASDQSDAKGFTHVCAPALVGISQRMQT